VLTIRALGRGQYRRTNVNKHGFPRGYFVRTKMVRGFQTGELVKAVVPKGKYAGSHEGTVLVRKSGYFDIRKDGVRIAQGVNAKYITSLQRFDGYAYKLELLKSPSGKKKSKKTKSRRSWYRRRRFS